MEEIKCPACWNDIPKESVNCPQCGFLLKSPQQSIPTQYTDIKEKENSIYPNYSSTSKNSVDINKKNKTIITVAVVLVALIFIVGISSSRGKKSKYDDYDYYSNNNGYSDYNSSYYATTGKEGALNKAKSYLNSSAFSYTGLIEQLEYEGFSNSEATYGADNCGAN